MVSECIFSQSSTNSISAVILIPHVVPFRIWLFALSLLDETSFLTSALPFVLGLVE
jgi:hypothetical protein